MASKIKKKQIVYLVAIVLLVTVGYVFFNFFRVYDVDSGQVENIDGISFPELDNTVITEKLAHADVYIDNNSFARALKITITFKPLDTVSLFVGIRENSFWLSYPKYQLCCTQVQDNDKTSTTSVTVIIPITDKIVDGDGSLDLMFFATNADSTNKEDEGLDDQTLWVLEDIQVTSVPVVPTFGQIKDYIKSRLTRERLL